MFLTPPTLTEDFRKIDRGLFWKKARRRRKIFGVPFFKNLTVFGKKIRKINGFLAFLTVFSASTTKKSPPQVKKFWGPFFQKIDVFRKNQRFSAVFNGFLAVFSGSTMKKGRRRWKIWEPLFFARRRTWEIAAFFIMILKNHRLTVFTNKKLNAAVEIYLAHVLILRCQKWETSNFIFHWCKYNMKSFYEIKVCID